MVIRVTKKNENKRIASNGDILDAVVREGLSEDVTVEMSPEEMEREASQYLRQEGSKEREEQGQRPSGGGLFSVLEGQQRAGRSCIKEEVRRLGEGAEDSRTQRVV